jgi:hypothetical protein
MLAAGALVAASLLSAAGARATTTSLALPFIDDDYPRAVALAKQRQVPIFVESWAPW